MQNEANFSLFNQLLSFEVDASQCASAVVGVLGAPDRSLRPNEPPSRLIISHWNPTEAPVESAITTKGQATIPKAISD